MVGDNHSIIFCLFCRGRVTEEVLMMDHMLVFYCKEPQYSRLITLKSKGPSKTLRDIRTSTYQICSSEEKNNSNNQISQMTM